MKKIPIVCDLILILNSKQESIIKIQTDQNLVDLVPILKKLNCDAYLIVDKKKSKIWSKK